MMYISKGDVWSKCFLTGYKCSRKVSRKLRPTAQKPFLHFITQDKEGPVVLCSTYTYAYGKGCKKLLWEEVTFDTVPLSDQKTLATN